MLIWLIQFFAFYQQWDLGTLQCLATAKGHSNAVMSLVCWDHYLVSGSLDGTIKAWGSTQEGGLEVCYTHEEEKVQLLVSINSLLQFCRLFLNCSAAVNRDLASFVRRWYVLVATLAWTRLEQSVVVVLCDNLHLQTHALSKRWKERDRLVLVAVLQQDLERNCWIWYVSGRSCAWWNEYPSDAEWRS